MKNKTKQILKNLNGAGKFTRLSWQRDLKTRADFPGVVTKITTAVVSSGTDYANRKSVREAIENGERGEVQPLPWGKWLDFPRVIAHTNKSGSYNEYVRLYPPSSAQMSAISGIAPTSEYFINGKLASKAECMPLCLASEFRDNDAPLECFTINADNVSSVGGFAV